MCEKEREVYKMPEEYQEQRNGQEAVKSLEELLYEKALTEDEALDLMIDLCGALELWERKNVLYGNICPENILLTKDGKARLKEPDTGERTGEDAVSYMAPELFHGQKTDRRADIYALGMVFYRIMNRGREPFVSLEKQIVGYKDRQDGLEKRMKGETLSAPADASSAFAGILLKACAFRPGKRYKDAGAFGRALKRCKRARKSRFLGVIGRWSPAKRVVAAVVLLAVVSGVSFGVWQQMPYQEYTDQETGDHWSISRNGTLTLEGEGAYMALCTEPDWTYWTTWIKKVVVCGNVKNLYCNFSSCVSLERVVLREGVEMVGPSSFKSIQTLKEVAFPSTLREIGEYAFSQCSSLERVKLPEGLETIRAGAFQLCTGLGQIEIPSSLTEIEWDVFDGTLWLENQKKNGVFFVINGNLIKYFGEEEEVEITEDMGIRCISSGAFKENKKIRSVILADTVEELKKDAFNGCISLESVKLPAALKELPEGLFRSCEALKEIVLPESLEKIGRYAFQHSGILKEPSIPETVTCVEEEVFDGTPWYEALIEGKDYAVWNGFLLECLIDEDEIVIPEELGIRRIADYAFAHKKKLKKVVIPQGVISLGEGCFFFCENLETIEFPESLKEFGRGPMAATKWMAERSGEGGPVLVNGVDVSY